MSPLLRGSVVSCFLIVGLAVASRSGCPACASAEEDVTSPPAFDPESGVTNGQTRLAADPRCLQQLEQQAAGAFSEMGPTKGIRTPVKVTGPLAGLRLEPRGRQPAVMDCELALALLEARSLFAEQGIDVMSFSAAYHYRTRRGSARLSNHAHGFAIDIHTLGEGENKLDVLTHFEANVGSWLGLKRKPEEEAGCIGAPITTQGRALRTLACRLKLLTRFEIIVTPDDDLDHKDHLHLEVVPRGPDWDAFRAMDHEAPVAMPRPSAPAATPRPDVVTAPAEPPAADSTTPPAFDSSTRSGDESRAKRGRTNTDRSGRAEARTRANTRSKADTRSKAGTRSKAITRSKAGGPSKAATPDRRDTGSKAATPRKPDKRNEAGTPSKAATPPRRDTASKVALPRKPGARNEADVRSKAVPDTRARSPGGGVARSRVDPGITPAPLPSKSHKNRAEQHK